MSTPEQPQTNVLETLQSLIVAFVMAMTFRGFVLEGFVIPTGSMAPSLLGQHFEVDCEQCGYRFTADHANESDAEGRSTRPLTVHCPMCRFPQGLPNRTASRSGDRLLVQKYLYNLVEPRRWDVVVFRNPQAYNDDGNAGGFGEMEYHDPGVIVANGPASRHVTCVTHALVGPDTDIQTFGRQLLGATIQAIE